MRIVCSADTFVRYENVDVICSTGAQPRQNEYKLFYCTYEDPDGTPANSPSTIQIQGNFLSSGCNSTNNPVNINLTISAGSKSASTEYLASYWTNCGDIGSTDCPNETIVQYSNFDILEATPTPTPTMTPTPTSSQVPLVTPSTTPTTTVTPSVTPSNTVTPSITPSNTVTPSITPSNTPTPSNSPIYNYNLVNECGSFTVFPFGVDYVSANPDSALSNNGSITLYPTGGTGPYSYYWVGGQRTQSLNNLPAGEYTVTVVDFYGDFSSTTVVNLSAPSATPTPTPTPTPSNTPQPNYTGLCLNVAFTDQAIAPIQFNYAGYYNGKPSWSSGSYQMRWINNRWEISGLSYYGGILISNTQSNIPDNGWILVGSNQTANIVVTQGLCTSSPLTINTQTNSSKCSDILECNGSVLINAFGGTPPYVYSLSNGNSYQATPLFSYLCEGTYVASVLDSSGKSVNKIVNVSCDNSQSDYVIYLEELSTQNIGVNTVTKTWQVKITPELPNGVYALFNLDISEKSYTFEPGSGETTVTSIVTKNAVTQTPFNTINSTSGANRPNCTPNAIKTVGKFKSYGLSLGKNDVITGYTTSYLNITNPQTSSGGCSTKLEQDIVINITNLRTSGCSCCNLISNTNSVKLENHIVDLSNTNPETSGTLYPVTFIVANNEIDVCTETTIYGFINSPIFVPGIKIYSTSGDLLTGYSYINYDSNIYTLDAISATVGLPTGNNC